MANGLWGHALTLSASSERRVRAAVTARFLASLPPRDPLLTLYCRSPAAVCTQKYCYDYVHTRTIKPLH